MSADIFRALGAALQTGVGTYGAISAQEREQKLREEQLAMQKARDEQSATRDAQMLDGQEKDRRFRILMAALDGSPGSQISADTAATAKEFGQEGRLQTLEQGSMRATGGGSRFMPAALPQVETQHLLKPTLQQQAAQEQLRGARDERDNANIWKTWMAGEGAEADYDTRLAKAESLGQKAPVVSMAEKRAEEDRVRAAENAQRIRELAIMYPPDRFGGRGGAAGGAGKAKVWDQNYNIIADNVRAKYSAELGAMSRAVAEGTATPDVLEGIRQRIESEITSTMEGRFGSRPVDTSELILAIDRDAQQAQGYWNLFRQVRTPEAQAALRRQGVDVQAYLTEVKRKADAEAVEFNARQGR